MSVHASAPTVAQSIIEVGDADALNAAFGAFVGEVLQVTRGAFNGRLQLMRSGGLSVVRASLNQAIIVRGEDPRGTFSFVPVTESNQGAIWRHGRRAPVGSVVVRGPSANYRNDIPKAVTTDLVVIGKARFHQAFLNLTGREFASDFEWVLLNSRTPAMARLNPALSQLFAMQRRACMRAMTSGDSTRAPALAPAVDPFDAPITRLLVELMGGCEEPTTPRLEQDAALLERAMMFMHGIPLQMLTAEALCAELGVSDRVLRRIFNRRFGVGPMAWARMLALHRVRDALKASHPGEVTVAEVARRFGFRRAGGFSAEYQRHFGELPSHTLGSRGYPGVQTLTGPATRHKVRPVLEFTQGDIAGSRGIV